MSSQYGELRPTNSCDRLASFGHPSKFQRVSRLAFVSAPTSPNRGQPHFARCLAVSCAGSVYIFLGARLITEFCQLQNSLCVKVLHCPILAVLLHGTRAMRVSQTLRHIFTRQDGHPIRHWGSKCLVNFLTHPLSVFHKIYISQITPRHTAVNSPGLSLNHMICHRVLLQLGCLQLQCRNAQVHKF